jgi:hypothetical protein
MGKTFWATALHDPDTRAATARAFPTARGHALDNVDVYFGFADREGAVGVASAEVHEFDTVDPEAVWRGLICSVLSTNCLGEPLSFEEATRIAANHPEDLRAVLRRVDDQLKGRGRRALVLFDQLDQLAENWPKIQKLTKALLRTALAMKSYRNIRIKIFMRTDQAADHDLFDFADASKIWGEAARLRWYSTDLYGLLYHWIWKYPTAREVLTKLCRKAGIRDTEAHPSYGIPLALAADPDVQGRVFDEIAGNKMGRGTKRGRPYSWIPAHLADAGNEISPRSFVTAMRVASDKIPETSQDLAIDFKRIHEGVREASEHRHRELGEDYPWIYEALRPLHGMMVPIDRRAIYDRWRAEDTPKKILDKYRDTKAPVEVLAAGMDRKSQISALENALQHVGVMEERTDNRINIPDIFRISAGIKRKGGITPQQRRRI